MPLCCLQQPQATCLPNAITPSGSDDLFCLFCIGSVSLYLSATYAQTLAGRKKAPLSLLPSLYLSCTVTTTFCFSLNAISTSSATSSCLLSPLLITSVPSSTGVASAIFERIRLS